MKLTTFLLILSASAALAATEEQTNKTFKVMSGGSLVVDVDFGSLEVNTNASSEVAVDAWRKVKRKNAAEEEKYLRENSIDFVQDGNTITVRCRQPEKKRWFNWGSGNQNEARYVILVPAGFNATLNTGGGAVAVSDLTGTVKAETSGGNLRFTRIRGSLKGETSGGGIRVAGCDGEIKIETSGGDVEVTGGSGSLKGETSGGSVTVKTFAGPASVETSGGEITVENIKGKIEGSTSGGDVNVVLLSPLPAAVKLSTSGGGVTVKIPEAAAFNLDAETSAGNVSCELPVAVEGKRKDDELKGKVNGGGQTVTLRTSGGNVRVTKL